MRYVPDDEDAHVLRHHGWDGRSDGRRRRGGRKEGGGEEGPRDVVEWTGTSEMGLATEGAGRAVVEARGCTCSIWASIKKQVGSLEQGNLMYG